MGFVNSARDPLTETQMRCNPNGGVELQEKNKKSREVKSRENVRENNKKFIENNMRIKIVKVKKYSNRHQIIQVMLCNKITLYSYILSL